MIALVLPGPHGWQLRQQCAWDVRETGFSEQLCIAHVPTCVDT